MFRGDDVGSYVGEFHLLGFLCAVCFGQTSELFVLFYLLHYIEDSTYLSGEIK
jgi:hypothetical protein